MFVHAQTHQRANSVDHSPVMRVTVAFNAHGVRPPILVLPGWAGQGVTCPTLLPLPATTPLTVGEFVRVPHLTIALIPLQQSVVYATVWAVLICRLSHTLRRWLRGWLRWSLDAEPLAHLLDLRLDAEEIHTAQGHHNFMAL